jgi:hypothetical protein
VQAAADAILRLSPVGREEELVSDSEGSREEEQQKRREQAW